MAGRYAFSLPGPRERDGWFRIGTLDVTTTVLVVLVGVASMFLYAFDPVLAFKGAFVTELVRQGDLWRLATWPLTNPPIDIWAIVGLAVFWFLGHLVEDEVGRKPFAVMLAAMTVIPAVIVTLVNVVNEAGTGRWSAYTYSVGLLSLGLITIFGVDKPNAKFFFGIPAWVIAAAYVLIEVLRDVGDRAWAELLLVLLVIAVGCIGARQRGMLEDVTFIPRLRRLGPQGSVPQEGSRSSRRSQAKRGRRRKSAPGLGNVTSGPWAGSNGPTPLEQAELDVLLDRISASGIKSLSKQEKARLNALSKRMRDS